MELSFFNSYMPHGHCYLWRADILWATVISDALIAVSYFSIPVALVMLTRKHPELKFNNVLLLFAIFIFSCGTVHIMDIWNIWHGHYGIHAVLKFITALASVLTAWTVWKIMPFALKIQGPDTIAEKTAQFEMQTTELQTSNNRLHDRVDLLIEELQTKNNEVTRKNEELEERTELLLQRNEELQEFAYITSHDLRSPLRNIAGFVQLLSRQYGEHLDEKAQDYISRTVKSTEKLQGLIDDILVFSRVESQGHEFSPIELTEVYEETLAHLATEISECGAQISCDDLPKLHVDKSQMIQLFSNLLANAMKYCDEQPPVIHISATQDNRYWNIHFQDNGIGIEEKFFTRIFEIFQRLHTDEEYPGSGIGLAVCQRVARRHNGNISVQSKPGQGSIFTLHLPIPRSFEK